MTMRAREERERQREIIGSNEGVTKRAETRQEREREREKERDRKRERERKSNDNDVHQKQISTFVHYASEVDHFI